MEEGIHGEVARTPKKTLKKHQIEALEKAHEHFKDSDRGKLIMACGTGKTFASLRVAGIIVETNYPVHIHTNAMVRQHATIRQMFCAGWL
ncbi:MAG: DEAD/DEAH box helicase family protein [Saprospiraceae bacterium]|nr:DEAD/DEAH box helicase family protein [Candidatus Opimibacter iunctus]